MSYIGKDVVHRGYGLELDPAAALRGISRAARKHVRKFAGYRVQARKCRGTREELTALRSIWYFPEDPNFPRELGERDVMYLAFEEGELLGGIVLVPVGGHLFLNNLVATGRGKELQIPSYLLWHVVNEYAGSEYSYIDVGVSYRPNLDRFFRSWGTFSYPVIFHPPEIGPRISFEVFQSLQETAEAAVDRGRVEAFCEGNPYTVLPSAAHAREVAAKTGREFTEPPFPRPGDGRLQVVDLTRCIPVQYGALLLGAHLSGQELWEEHGCFDFVKTRLVEAQLGRESNAREVVMEKRKEVFAAYERCFAGEDVTLRAADDCLSAAVFGGDFAAPFARACDRFGVDHRLDGERLLLPCHQNLSANDVEYLYAIYRGTLNLCSQWTPTHVRGVLKI